MVDQPLPGTPPDQVGTYRILEFLGEGGMATVYLALDTELGRRVALKWLKQATPVTMDRLRQEAHLHARVEHPAVCRLYQVDVWQGWPFLVMQLIQGTTLDRVAPELSRTTLLRLFVALADGVHAAHREGLIHRDLKPSNMMVEADGAGGWRPYVTDFGLARDASSGSLTEAGMLLGSPAYMAPEQVTSGWVDVRTDVYGLGASLFEVLTGRPPFLGQAPEILLQVQTQDPPRLRQLVPDLPRDLETVVETCLARDLARRYPSAAAFRDDLVRFLDGEPVRARRVSFLERLALRVRRNRMVSALALVLCLSLAATGGVWEAGRRRALAKAYWAERFGHEAMRMDNLMRFGRMLPPHDIAREFAQVRGRMEAVRLEMARIPLSRGPGHFVLGQGALILGDPAAARPELEQAWAQGDRSAEVALALGLCLTGLFETEQAKTLGILNPAERSARQRELRRDLGDPGRAFLARARAERGAVFSRVEETRLLLAEGRLDEAARSAQAAYEAEPWRYEALFYLAKALAYRGRDALIEGREAEARTDFGRVLDLLDAAGRIGPSDDRIQDVRQFIWSTGCQLALGGLDRQRSLERALAACYALRALNGTRTDYLNQHALILTLLGEEQARHGKDPEPCFGRAEALMRTVVGTPRQGAGSFPALMRAKALERLASLAHKRAAYASDRKQDPRPFIEEGLRFCQQALDEGMAQWETHQDRAILCLDLAEARKAHGQESLDSLERAAQSFRDCAGLNPSAASWSNLAEALNLQAKRRMERGEDPRPALGASRQAIQTALTLAPGAASTLEIQRDLEKLEAQGVRRSPGAALSSAR